MITVIRKDKVIVGKPHYNVGNNEEYLKSRKGNSVLSQLFNWFNKRKFNKVVDKRHAKHI